MKFMVECPVPSDADGGAWLSPDNLVEFARTAEASRGRTRSRSPITRRRRRSGSNTGGHETFDPFVALGFCAAVTSRIDLMTNLTVVPYRNPLLMARSMTSVDVLVGWADDLHARHRLPALRVRRARRRLRGAQRALRRGDRGVAGDLVDRRLLLRGPPLQGDRSDHQARGRCRSRTHGSGSAGTPRSCSTAWPVGGTAGRRSSVAARRWRAPRAPR